MTSVPSYREQLHSQLKNRCARRPGYSLRAFARDLGYGPSQLSRVMNGKQHLSPASARLIAERLFDSQMDQEAFVARVEHESSPKDAVRVSARKRLETLEPEIQENDTVLLEQDAFVVISEWYHLPILDLMTLHDRPATPAAVAAFLGISKAEAGQAIERLIRLKLLKHENGRYAKTHGKLLVPSGGPNGGVRKFHRSMIEKGLRAIEGQSVERRYLSARTVAFAPKDLPKFKAAVDEFMRKLSELTHASRPKTKLYQVTTQMFDLDNREPVE